MKGPLRPLMQVFFLIKSLTNGTKNSTKMPSGENNFAILLKLLMLLLTTRRLGRSERGSHGNSNEICGAYKSSLSVVLFGLFTFPLSCGNVH
jgi:hypothetical protein